MDTSNAVLAGRARGILKAQGSLMKPPAINVSEIGLKRDFLHADVEIRTQHGHIFFDLMVGKLSASEHKTVTDLNLFRPAVREAIEMTRDFRADIRIAVFRQEKAPTDYRYLPNTYFLEILLLTGDQGEAVLSLKLEDFHLDQKYVQDFMEAADPMGFFHAQVTAGFASVEKSTEAKHQFKEACPHVILMEYNSPNGYTFLRAFDEETNDKLIKFLRTHHYRNCTIHPAGIVS